jgi:hypothetical protein
MQDCQGRNHHEADSPFSKLKLECFWRLHTQERNQTTTSLFFLVTKAQINKTKL